jgi:ABC-type multidrug transport system ATPase subunit
VGLKTLLLAQTYPNKKLSVYHIFFLCCSELLIAGEMLVGLARCFFMDDISTGLDSSTTYAIIKFIQQMTHMMDLTVVISLLQPPPETLELFDDIILLCEGQIVYHGPRESATNFFEVNGFKCPARKNVSDFLQEVLYYSCMKEINYGAYHLLSLQNYCSEYPMVT